MTLAQLIAAANIIKNEFLSKKNTALRIGQMFLDIINRRNENFRTAYLQADVSGTVLNTYTRSVFFTFDNMEGDTTFNIKDSTLIDGVAAIDGDYLQLFIYNPNGYKLRLISETGNFLISQGFKDVLPVTNVTSASNFQIQLPATLNSYVILSMSRQYGGWAISGNIFELPTV
jgi:hypothetical protein